MHVTEKESSPLDTFLARLSKDYNIIVIWKVHAWNEGRSQLPRNVFMDLLPGLVHREFQSSPIDLSSLRLISKPSFKIRSAGQARSFC